MKDTRKCRRQRAGAQVTPSLDHTSVGCLRQPTDRQLVCKRQQPRAALNVALDWQQKPEVARPGSRTPGLLWRPARDPSSGDRARASTACPIRTVQSWLSRFPKSPAFPPHIRSSASERPGPNYLSGHLQRSQPLNSLFIYDFAIFFQATHLVALVPNKTRKASSCWGPATVFKFTVASSCNTWPRMFGDSDLNIVPGHTTKAPQRNWRKCKIQSGH